MECSCGDIETHIGGGICSIYPCSYISVTSPFQQIIEKSPDGWWTGRIENTTGDFPASFVEEIPVPKSKDEAKKLVKRYKSGKLGHDANARKRDQLAVG